MVIQKHLCGVKEVEAEREVFLMVCKAVEVMAAEIYREGTLKR